MNLISNDLNLIEDKIHFVPKLFIVPFFLIGAIILLTVRYGWQGAVGTISILFFFAISYSCTIVTAKIISKINDLKDKRIKLIS
jgi:glucose-6-phosphate-specific signal transduction histidine kinase